MYYMNIKTLLCSIRVYFFKGWLSAYSDGALDRVTRTKVIRLLEQCPEAKAYLEQLLRLDRTIKAVPSLMPPDSLKQKIDSAIINSGSPAMQNRRSAKAHPHAWVYILSSVFIVIAAITLTFGIKRHGRNARQSETMFASMDMYRHMDLYEHMDMIEHMKEVMTVDRDTGNNSGVVK